MKVLVLAADKGGCGFYRCLEPARVVKDLGFNVEVSYGLDVEAEQDRITKMVTVDEIHTDADLIIVQRPLSNSLTSMLRQAKRQGIATIVELDDDFDTTHTRNRAHKGMFGYEHSGVKWIHEACSIADHVTVSTPALEKYAPHGRVSVLRNCVPESYLDVNTARDLPSTPVIGWTGTVQTHPTDLQVTKGSVAEVLSKNNLPFAVVGDGDSVQKNLKLSSSTPFSFTGWVDREEYLPKIPNTMDIGIVPLEMSNFNDAKSAIKGLEMASVGVPFVASPTREYLRLEAYGVGKTAKSPGDWRRHLQRWIDRPSNMEQDIVNYRDIIGSTATYELHASDWATVWEQTVAYRKSHNA